MSISVKHINKLYGDQRAVDDISFDIPAGQIVGFIGPNGAGKSTTMKIITGYLPPTSGDVWVDDLHIAEHPRRVKSIIGYLPENNPLYPELYVKEYLLYVAGLYGLHGTEADRKVEQIIDETGLSPERRKKIGNLSKGYRQRVGISQALIHDPNVLILDEPTSGLDPNQIVEIRNLISNVGREKTILLSTHIMQEVEAICDRVIIIHDGAIAADEAAGDIGNRQESKQTIQVELETETDADTWKQLEEVHAVRQLPGRIYLLETGLKEDIRSKIFKFAVDHELTVLSMIRKEKSLETVFRELTGRK